MTKRNDSNDSNNKKSSREIKLYTKKYLTQKTRDIEKSKIMRQTGKQVTVLEDVSPSITIITLM